MWPCVLSTNHTASKTTYYVGEQNKDTYTHVTCILSCQACLHITYACMHKVLRIQTHHMHLPSLLSFICFCWALAVTNHPPTQSHWSWVRWKMEWIRGNMTITLWRMLTCDCVDVIICCYGTRIWQFRFNKWNTLNERKAPGEFNKLANSFMNTKDERRRIHWIFFEKLCNVIIHSKMFWISSSDNEKCFSNRVIHSNCKSQRWTSNQSIVQIISDFLTKIKLVGICVVDFIDLKSW